MSYSGNACKIPILPRRMLQVVVYQFLGLLTLKFKYISVHELTFTEGMYNSKIFSISRSFWQISIRVELYYLDSWDMNTNNRLEIFLNDIVIAKIGLIKKYIK